MRHVGQLHVALAHDVVGRAVAVVVDRGDGGGGLGSVAAEAGGEAGALLVGGSADGRADVRLVSGVGLGVGVVAVGGALLGLEEEVSAREGVDEHVDDAGQGHHGAGEGEVRAAGDVVPGDGHAAGGERQGENHVYDRVDDHVDDDAVEALEALLLAAVDDGGLPHAAAQVEEHDAVEHDGAELGEEDPDVVVPETDGLVFGTEPALPELARRYW